jgi:hypothetical protein
MTEGSFVTHIAATEHQQRPSLVPNTEAVVDDDDDDAFKTVAE